jgi:uncharacterized protein
MFSMPLRWLVAPLALLTSLLTAGAADAPKPLLWRIEGTKPSYVFGTIHLSNPQVTKLAPATQKAVESADALFTEIPMDMADQLKMSMAMMGAESLSQVLPKDLYTRAEAELKRINPAMTLKPLENLKIWALAMLITMLEEQMKNPGAMPLDAILFAKAKGDGKEVGGIETLDEQLKVFETFSKDDQIVMLTATLDDVERARKEGRSPLAEMQKAYLTGDLEQLDKTMNEWMTGMEPKLLERFLEALFTKRNQLMAERIAAKLKSAPDKSQFFAIGAGHLIGDTGVLKLLEKQGLKLTRVTEGP